MEFLIMYGWAILIVLVCLGAIIYFSNAPSRGEDFCKGDLANGRGAIDYCDGKPFICQNNVCHWVERPVVGEECTTHVIGKSVITKCEEVLE